MARRPPARAPAQTKAPEGDGEWLFLLGQLVEGQKQQAQQLADIQAVQREQASAIQHLAEVQEQTSLENERAHGDTESKLAALGAKVAGLSDTVGALTQAGLSAGRTEKPKDSPIKVWGEAFTFLKAWWPGLVAVAAGVWAFIERLTNKGGTPQP